MGEQITTTPTIIPTVLYLDDDAGNRQAFVASFRREFRILLADEPKAAWDLMAKEEVHVFLADQRMPGTQGSQVLNMAKERYPMVRRMLMTGYSDIQAVIDAINIGGVSHYLAKPWDPSEVVHAVRSAFAEYQQENGQKSFTERLVVANEQLEFALRQRLLS